MEDFFQAYHMLGKLFLKRYIWHEMDGTVILTIGYSIVKYDRMISNDDLAMVEGTSPDQKIRDWNVRPLEPTRKSWLYSSFDRKRHKLTYKFSNTSSNKDIHSLYKTVTIAKIGRKEWVKNQVTKVSGMEWEVYLVNT